MKKLVLVMVTIFSAMPALAEQSKPYPIVRQGADWVQLSPESCSNETIVAKLQEDARYRFYAAKAHFNGQDFNACWTEANGAVALVYEDGDQGAIPADQFKIEDWI